MTQKVAMTQKLPTTQKLVSAQSEPQRAGPGGTMEKPLLPEEHVINDALGVALAATELSSAWHAGVIGSEEAMDLLCRAICLRHSSATPVQPSPRSGGGTAGVFAAGEDLRGRGLRAPPAGSGVSSPLGACRQRSDVVDRWG